MKTVIEMAREIADPEKVDPWDARSSMCVLTKEELERLVALIRADERNSWPAEMEAMERQVNILTDALNDRQRWFDALKAQHKQSILAERKACADLCDRFANRMMSAEECADAIRARSNT